MNDSLVSVILTCYNQEKYLSDALDSVLCQTYSNWECIILNDGSTDDSEKVALEYAKKDSRFKYIYQKNQGVVVARNNAVHNSLGKYLLPLDGDDMIANNYLELAVAELEADQNIDLVICEVEKFGAEKGSFKLNDICVRNILANGCCVNCSMFRRSSYDKIGGYKECMSKGYEDWEFFISLLEFGGRVKKINQVLFYYRIIETSRNNKIDIETDRKLKACIVSMHPELYFFEYSKLLDELKTIKSSKAFWGYKLLLKIKHFICF